MTSPTHATASGAPRARPNGPGVAALAACGRAWLALAVGIIGGCAPVARATPGESGRGPAAAPRDEPSRRAASQESRGGAVDEGGRIVRVALAVDGRDVRIGASADGEWRLYDESGRTVLARIPRGAAWTLERRRTQLRAVGPGGATVWRDGPLVARAVALGAMLTHDGRRYRGELWAHAGSGEGTITLVNRLPIEEYLRGVVPLELNAFGASEGAALAAQAVAARSYTYSRLPEFEPREVAVRQAQRPFDLRATVSDQVYGGADAERGPSDQAVRATAGLVIRYGGAVVSAPYHSTCGGTTAEPQELWQSRAEPYLRRVSDRIPGTDRHYCDAAPRFRWTREFDGASLDAVLARYLRTYAREATGGAARGSGAVGAARSLRIEAHTPSGRVGTLAVTTDAGRFALRGNDIRFTLRSPNGEILPSTYFSVESGGGASDGNGRVTRVTLRGHGNGHGVGMCQWGAIGRSRSGQDFRTILRTYFPGTAVEPAE